MLALAALGGLAGLLALGRCAAPRSAPSAAPAPFSVAETLRAPSDAGYARALAPRAFRFPADHGPHPDFRTEWWYFTGNLASPAGRRFGFQLTFFRSALAPAEPASPPRASAWATRQAWLAHFALGDVQGKRFRAFESWGREALGIAGGRAEPLRVWLRGWSAEARSPSGLPLRLRAEAEGPERIALDLVLEPGKPLVLQGDRGLSRKSAEPGNASYYYSLPRLPARGEITLGADRFPVSGLAWMDREWSTSALGRGQVGWDWFSLQLSDGRELMLYRLRRADGSADPASSGTLIGRDGRPRTLAADAVEIQVLDHWTSPGSGVRYPSGWRLRIPAEALDLTVRPLLADQEVRTSFRYWEGAVAVSGAAGAAPVRGQGFAELTGYGAPPG
jgi:predicted secreted hydrolase